MTMSEYRPWSPITRVSELVLLTNLGLSIPLGLGGPLGQGRDVSLCTGFAYHLINCSKL